ncbi:putative HTH-type transcriptional regulator YxaF [Sporosarcina sp. NCCP-2716]|uniref:TetR/AcrR family transcriptional regulator n=1 Tax=Sporosarcina sp. NCCP-2716 TaxID=2943679 RepID=UPI00203AE88B|nr:TetR/AcrR family transcriptional regulator [Sporosarcina sp. NCCP-2716]GKV69724.1 putative HTH-type transcriptional regulator YxaF [Sporosarcina sp. NCCP-2716]
MSKVQSREKMLEAATRLFHLKGYHATGVNQILQESGAPKGSLYYHFPGGKEQLAAEAIQLSGQLIAGDIRVHLDKYEDAVQAFQQLIQFIAGQFERIDGLLELPTVPLGLLAAETAQVNEHLRQTCEETFGMWESLYIGKLLQCGYSDERARVISTSMIALIEGSVTLSLTRNTNGPLLQIRELIPALLSMK